MTNPYYLNYNFCWDWLVYWEEYWRHEENWCCSNSSERPLVNAGIKNSQEVNNRDQQEIVQKQ